MLKHLQRHERLSPSLLVMLLLAALLPSIATAQRGEPQPIWLADAQLEGVSRETASGYDFFVTGETQVGSEAGPVSGMLVQVVLTGPAGEQIHTEAITGRDGTAVINVSVPGPGNYGSTLYDMHGDGYYYDPRQNQSAMPTFILNPPPGVAALVEQGTVDQVRWFKPGTIASSAILLSSWDVSGQNSGSAAAIAVDSAGYVYTGSVYEGWSICAITKHTWYGVPVTGYPAHFFGCPEGRGGVPRVALASNLYNELLIGRNGPGLTITVDRYNAGGSLLASWDIDIPTEVPPHVSYRALGDIAADAQGRIYVTFEGGSVYTQNHQGVKVTSNTGTPLFELDDMGVEEQQFFRPRGIDIDAAGNIFVAEPYPGRVKHLTLGSTGLTISDVWPIQLAPSFGSQAFAVSGWGNVFISDAENLHIYAGANGTPASALVGWITQQAVPQYASVVSIDVTP